MKKESPVILSVFFWHLANAFGVTEGNWPVSLTKAEGLDPWHHSRAQLCSSVPLCWKNCSILLSEKKKKKIKPGFLHHFIGPSGLREDCQDNRASERCQHRPLSWPLQSFGSPKKVTWFNVQAISITDARQRLCCCLYGWLSISCGKFVASSCWHRLAEAQPFEETGREKNPRQDVCTCCSLPLRLGVLLKDWAICTERIAVTTGACPVWGWSSPSTVEVWEGAARRGRRQPGKDRTTRSIHRQTWLKYFKPNGLWHKQDSSTRDLQWIWSRSQQLGRGMQSGNAHENVQEDCPAH